MYVCVCTYGYIVFAAFLVNLTVLLSVKAGPTLAIILGRYLTRLRVGKAMTTRVQVKFGLANSLKGWSGTHTSIILLLLA